MNLTKLMIGLYISKGFPLYHSHLADKPNYFLHIPFFSFSYFFKVLNPGIDLKI